MKNMFCNMFAALMVLPLIGSCGKSGSSSNNGLTNNTNNGRPSTGSTTTEGTTGRQNEEAPVSELEGSIDGSTIEGQYLAKFITLNPQVNGTIPGALTLFRDSDRLLTYIRLFAGKPQAWHQQGIYMGTRCPVLTDDTNKDGYIDINEALAVVGKLIVPLDANMNSQASGKNFYPLADLSGYYHYEREASFSRMWADLKDVDREPNDNLAKLGPDEKFAFAGRVVMVQGVSEDTLLPATVGTEGRRRPFQTLPITCGVIAKSTEAPGTPDTGEIPGPIAEVIADQDVPAPEDDMSTGTAQGGTVSGRTGGGTNENEDGQVGDEGGAEGGGTVGGTTTGGTVGGTTSGGSAGGSTSGGTTTGGSTTGGRSGGNGNDDGDNRHGGFIGGFIGGSSGGSGRSTGGFIGGFIGGSDGR